MYKDIDLASVTGNDPNKCARNIAKILFSNNELMTCLLPIEPILELNEAENNEQSDEENENIMTFQRNKNSFVKRKVKLLAGNFLKKNFF